MHCNVNGIRTHTTEKVDLLKRADIISIQDTRVREGHQVLESLFPAHCIYESKHGNQAGTALLINNKIKHRLLNINTTNGHVLLSVEINDHRFSRHPVVISSLYVPPMNARHRSHPFDVNLFKLALNYKYAILIGDFNSRHLQLGCRGTNTHGRAFLNYLHSSNNVILNNMFQPTFSHTAQDFVDVLDYAIATPHLTN